MSFTINGVPCLFVVDSTSRSCVSSRLWSYLGSSDLDEPVHLSLSLPPIPKFSISLNILTGEVPPSATSSNASVCLDMDWLAIAVRTAFNGDSSAALRALSPYFRYAVASQSSSFTAVPIASSSSSSLYTHGAVPAPPVQMYQTSGWGSIDPRAHSYDTPVVKHTSIPLYFIPSHDPVYLFSLQPQQFVRKLCFFIWRQEHALRIQNSDPLVLPGVIIPVIPMTAHWAWPSTLFVFYSNITLEPLNG
ncbi:hypothetical protein AAF712_016044 [Marasmius tenuissimus]|uniref:Uncharacterized protein n=1 Tax=Marasmius tenuissimus TaxID=585030 RepID=A0ABR2Z7V5_9AGAR